MDMDAMLEAYSYPATTPWLRANMISSLDGAIRYKGDTGALGYAADWELMRRFRTLADVVVMGATTIREYGEYPASAAELAIVSRSLDLDFDGPLFADAPVPPLLYTCASAPADRLRKARTRARVLLHGEHDADIPAMLADLADRGLARQLCEGGPTLLAEIAAAGRVDELCLTLSPVLVAGDAPRIMNGRIIDLQRMTLRHAIQDGDYLFLRYLRAAPAET
ncbi:dihydrofolate reductase family protein [Actinomadura rayongensis]|uniref:Pyrimidine reductase family protein n=1 Tax=Actinomadura rayongensis TaxID=1429076 RepID=A0A6I4WN17_9ACTN|nr:dihydrofolate reductase family protein [Actinomadura rayongensis]MXQ68082.1 pyrimidine reductase family protein [Actinomadura rayongensis]